MATEYHLITAFGTGKTCTMTIASPCVVTYTNHGLSNGFPVVFTTTGALPTGITSGTTYYAKSTGANTFNLYTDSALTSIVNTSGTQSGTHTITSDYWYNLPTTGTTGNWKNRYYYDSAYRVYDTLAAWLTALSGRYNYNTDLTVEIAGKWTDYTNAYTDQFHRFHSLLITSKVNNEWSDAFHYGVIGSGWMQRSTSNGWRSDYATVEGLDIVVTGSFCFINTNPTEVRYCLIKSTTTHAFGQYGGGHKYHHNLVYDSPGYGIAWADYSPTVLVYNNTVIHCGSGFEGKGKGYIVNNVSFGCTTANWGTAPTSGYFNNNAGLTGEAWTSAGATRVVVSSSDFENYVVPVDATSDFSPSGDSTAHTSSSSLVDAAYQQYADMIALDIRQHVVPSYKNGAATNWDIGAYEFDWGYGLAPASCTLTISAPVSLVGAEIRIYDYDNNPAGSFGTELSGVESCTTSTYTYTGLANNTIYIQIMLDGWVEFGQTLILTEGNLAFYALMQSDPNE